MTGSLPKEIDHDNGNKHDNSWANLRPCNHSQNNANKPVSKLNKTTGVKGVTFDGERYCTSIKHNKKSYPLGCYPTLELAKQIYDKKGLELFGEFHRP